MGNKLSRSEVKKLQQRKKVTQKVGSKFANQCGTSNIGRKFSNYQTAAILRDAKEQSVDTIWVTQKSPECMCFEEPGNREILCMETVLDRSFYDEENDLGSLIDEAYGGPLTKTQILELNHHHQPISFASDDYYNDDDKVYSFKYEQHSSGPKDSTSHGSPGSSKQNGRDSTDVPITLELSQCMGYEEMVNIFQPLIIKNLIVREILPYLPFIEDHDEIYAAEKRSKSEAVISLLNELKSCKEVGKWHKFIEALSACGYEYIVQNIRGYKFINHHYQEQYIKTLAPKLSKMLQPIVLLPRLYKEEVISENDREEIEMETRNRGNIASANLLLNRIPKKHSKWYTKFIKVLRQEGYDEIADDLDILHLTEERKTKHTSIFGRHKPLIPWQNTPSKPRQKPLFRPSPPQLPTSRLKLNVLTDASKIKTNVDVVEPANETLFEEENLNVEQEVYSDPEYEPIQPMGRSNSKDELNWQMNETCNQCSRENCSSKCAPPLSPRGIPPKPQNHSNLFFIPTIPLPRQDINEYQTIERDLLLDTDLVGNSLQDSHIKEAGQGCDMFSRSSTDEKFQILRTELSGLENEAADLDKEVRHLEIKNGLQSDINIKLRQRRDLLRDIDKKEREAEALKGPLDEPEADQAYAYGYLESADALMMKNTHRHGCLQRKRTMTFHNTSDGMFRKAL